MSGRPESATDDGGATAATIAGERAPSGWATRLDRRAGLREEAGFFGGGPSRMFGVVQTPLARPVAGVVVCSPLGVEFLRGNRREVLLGRALAPEGVAMMRFHYRGSGSSDGETRDLTFDTMLEDALAATAELRRRTGLSRLAFLGTRLGAVVAAAVAARHPGAPVALWEPALDGREWLDEVFRARLVQELRGDGSGEARDEDPAEILRGRGVVDVLGHPIHRAFHDTARPRRLAAELGEDPRPILLAQIGRRQRLRHGYQRLVSEWTAKGFEVETRTFVQSHEAWWFATPDESAPPGARMALQRPVIEDTATWFAGVLRREAP